MAKEKASPKAEQEPAPEPVPEPVPQPVPEPIPQPVPEPVPQEVPGPVPQEVPEPAPEEPEPVPEPVPQPVASPVSESESENESEHEHEHEHEHDLEGRPSVAAQVAIPETERAHHPKPHGRYLATLMLSALGVVYGDIGTSPLYALRECFHPSHGLAVNAGNVLGILSMIFWSLMIVVTLKYLVYVLRADNKGEGGELALMALARSALKNSKALAVIGVLGIFGASLLYGDGMITPAISVLGAMEGLVVATTAFERWVVPLTVLILIGLFLPQRFGTASVGAVFGPVMLVWFVVLATLGVSHIVTTPVVLSALSPHHAISFVAGHGEIAFVVAGSVFLVVTGGEALYTDMGHFGARPIRITWLFAVMPALLLNYFGQGALLIKSPEAVENPFFMAAPRWALYPLVALSLAAAVIASQAVISGAFSITRQATMLGLWPRLQVQHTSARQIGQIYVPSINWILMLASIGLVLGFRSSSNLAAAYGIAVSTTMVITTLLAFAVARYLWKWSLPAAVGLTALLLVVDLSFFSANALKIAHGGWFPLVIGASIFILMTTWRRGRELLGERIRSRIVPLEDFLELLHVELPARVPGTAVFMTSNPEGAPPALMQTFTLVRSVHKEVILLTILTTEAARVTPEERVSIEHLPEGFVRVVARYGFMEQPDIPALLHDRHIPNFSLDHTTFFLGRETLLPVTGAGMSRWRQHIFSFMNRNSQRAATFFNVPSDRVLEIGSQIEL